MKRNLAYLVLLLAVTSLLIGLTRPRASLPKTIRANPCPTPSFSLREDGRTLSDGCSVLILKNTWAPLPWW